MDEDLIFRSRVIKANIFSIFYSSTKFILGKYKNKKYLAFTYPLGKQQLVKNLIFLDNSPYKIHT